MGSRRIVRSDGAVEVEPDSCRDVSDEADDVAVVG